MHQEKFLTNLKNKILNIYTNDIYWDIEHRLLVIKDKEHFFKNIFPLVYKKKESSFKRQLNIYGFMELKNADKNGKKLVYENTKYTIRDFSDEEIKSIEQQKKEEKNSSKVKNIFEDKNYKIDTNKDKVNNLIKKEGKNDNDLKEIFYYLYNNGKEDYDFTQAKNEIHLLKKKKKNLLG